MTSGTNYDVPEAPDYRGTMVAALARLRVALGWVVGVLVIVLAHPTSRTIAAKVGHLLRARLRASGGVLPETWTIMRGSLPSGIQLARDTGMLSGKPRHAGTARIVLRVRDALGAVSTATIVLHVGS